MTIRMRTAGVVLAVGLAACGSARRSEPLLAEPTELSGKLREGEIAFMHYCHACHPHGAAGLGPSLNEKPLPQKVVAFQVRQGLGEMPAFSERVISEEALDAITDYLDWLEDRDPVGVDRSLDD